MDVQCSKKRNAPLVGAFFFLEDKSVLTGVEGEAASGNERFALRGRNNENLSGKARR